MTGFDLDQDVFDPEMSDKGTTVEFFNGSTLTLASTENKRYKSLLARKAKQHKLQLDTTNEDSFELVNRITCEALAKHVLLGWTGINFKGKQNVPYTIEVGIEALMASKTLREFVIDQAGTAANFQKTVVDTVKN